MKFCLHLGPDDFLNWATNGIEGTRFVYAFSEPLLVIYVDSKTNQIHDIFDTCYVQKMIIEYVKRKT